ncbi:MAG: hypothetical protein GF335_03780 [Candidatus Moranbacteria bacterium]|nr:hypothetical protein [Candidatus Moranbacteria bacterium]
MNEKKDSSSSKEEAKTSKKTNAKIKEIEKQASILRPLIIMGVIFIIIVVLVLFFKKRSPKTETSDNSPASEFYSDDYEESLRQIEKEIKVNELQKGNNEDLQGQINEIKDVVNDLQKRVGQLEAKRRLEEQMEKEILEEYGEELEASEDIVFE